MYEDVVTEHTYFVKLASMSLELGELWEKKITTKKISCSFDRARALL